MMRLLLYILFSISFFHVLDVTSQDVDLLDSVLIRLENPENDSIKADLLNTAAAQYQNSDLNKVKYYADSALKLSQKIDYPNGVVRSYFNLGNLNYIKGDFSLTLDYYTKALKVLEEEGDQKGVASALMGIGNVQSIIGEHEKAIEYQMKSLAIRINLNDSIGIAGNYNNLGSIYTDMKDYETSLEYHFKSLDIKIALEHWKGMSSSYGNIGGIYNTMGRYVEALEYQRLALEIREKLNNKKGISMSYIDIGNIHFSLKEYDKALENQQHSLRVAQEVGFGKGVVNALLSISSTYEKLGKEGDALNYYKEYKATQDSLFNLDKAAEMAKIESQYESEKQELEIVNLNKEKKINEIKREKEREISTIQLDQEKRKGYLMYTGLIAALVIAFLILIALINKRKANKRIQEQKKVVEEAKEIIEEKQEEILDSIYYAKHIQKAILPSQKFMDEHIPESFVFYKPKAIVSGDFYWMEAVNDKIIFAAADCTGHGVPGAIVSVVCHNALNRAVREFGLLDPGNILDKTNELVEETFAKSEEKVRDGMDIALCVIDLKNNAIQFSGAKNPLWIVRDGTVEIEEVAATPRPIGFNDGRVAYVSNQVEVNIGDSFYMFTDGFQDQFGGLKGKKYKQRKFKDFIVQNSIHPMAHQKNRLRMELESWKGDIEQIDDVCIIGFKL